MRAHYIVLISSIHLFSLTAFAVADSKQAVPAEGHHLVAVIRENAERIRSGEFYGSGTLTIEGIQAPKAKAAPRSHVYDETVKCIFDFDNNLFSFERQRTARPGASSERKRLIRFVSRPDCTIAFTEFGGTLTVELHNPGLPPAPEEVRMFAPIFDPRMIGLGGLLRLHGMFEEQFAVEFPDREMTVHDEGLGLLRLQCETKLGRNKGSLRTWWCDQKQGMQPVRSTFKIWDFGGSEYSKLVNQRSVPFEESSAEWTRVGDVWLPRSVDLFGMIMPFKARVQLEIDWRNVNESVDEARFDWRQWDLPEGTAIVDYRLLGDAPVILAIVGYPEQTELGMAHGRRGWFSAALLALNACVISGLLGVAAKHGVTRWRAAIKRAN